PPRSQHRPIRGMEPGNPLLQRGDTGTRVRDLQARLAALAWYFDRPDGRYDADTVAAVRGFQRKREIPVTGRVDQRTLDRLHAMTGEPTRDQLGLHNVPGPLDPRCRTGRVLCVDKSSQTLRWVVDGQVRKTVDVRFGATYTPTREGVFSVYLKSRDHVSRLYDSPMPFAMFFSGGQAVHYSSDFAARGYSGASHGCVNVRDYDAVAWLYDQVQVGDEVVVYWS
ncbi:MAG TPA: L,D-transpeptidase family protein, partial [Nocardioides sp.]|nr:L,D-transpeptidase family protein [Nocardioides sp.]